MNPRSLFSPISPIILLRFLLVSSVVLFAIGCGQSSEVTAVDSAPPDTHTATDQPDSDSDSIATAANQPESNSNKTLISDQGIGEARLGMSLGELKDILGAEAEFTVESPFMTDFDAVAVRKNGDVQYYVLYLAGETLADTDVIQGLLTDNPAFQTAEGVGTGTPIVEAEQVYGSANLSYNTLNESREYVRFENQPANNISFATGDGSQNPAGIYTEPTGEYNETESFREDATIQSVLVICLSEACAPPRGS